MFYNIMTANNTKTASSAVEITNPLTPDLPMADISTPKLSAPAESSPAAAPSALTLCIIRQFARAYVPAMGGVVLN